MSDTRYDSLFDLRGELEKNIADGIKDDLSTYDRLNSVVFQKDRARFELIVRKGSANGHRKVLSTTDRRYDQFNFSLSVTVISQPQSNPADNNYHQILVSHIDAYISQLQLASKDDLVNFPKLTILELRDSGHEPELKPQEGIETTRLNYTGQFGIRATAWTS